MEQYDLMLEAKETNDKDRTITYIATKESVDSMGRIFKVAGMDLSHLKKFKSIYWNHNTDERPIAKATSIRKRNGDEVLVAVQFATEEENSFADSVYRLVRGNYINGGSVGISADLKDVEYPEKPMKVGGKEVRMIVHKSKLKEFSITPTPANENAVPLNASLDKAMEDGIINEEEVKEFQLMCSKDENLESTNEDTNNPEQRSNEDNITLKARVAELELQLKEQEMEEETQDSVYDALYDEFVEPNQEDNEDKDILDEYFDMEE